MNNAELQSHLRQFPDDLEIITARDEEGNGFNKLHSTGGIGVAFIEKNADKHGYVEYVIDPSDIGEDKDYELDDVEPRLVIWP